jgi:transcriptional regulator with XRE-family HTH domain
LKTIGDRIKNIREDLELSQEEFAAKIHKSVRSVKYYEQNERITLELLRTIANNLDISIFSLFTNSDDLFKLFISQANLKNLSSEKSNALKLEFNSFMEFLANKYKK